MARGERTPEEPEVDVNVRCDVKLRADVVEYALRAHLATVLAPANLAPHPADLDKITVRIDTDEFGNLTGANISYRPA